MFKWVLSKINTQFRILPPVLCYQAFSTTYWENVPVPDRILPFSFRISFCSLWHLRYVPFESIPAVRQSGRVPVPTVEKKKQEISVTSPANHYNIFLTIISRSFSILAINLLNCLRLSTITCSSSVCVEPMHSKLKSAKLFDRVRCARDRSKKKKENLLKQIVDGNQLRLPIR